MSFEAYSVAIRLKLLDGVSTGLIGLASHFSAFNQHVNGSQAGLLKLEGQLQRIKMLGIAGGAAMGLGGGMLYMLEGPIKAAREYELAFTKFKTLNLGEAVNKQADHFARSADIMGVSAKQLMTTMAESVGIFGSYGEAQKYTPKLAALNAANSAIFHGKIGDIDEGATRSLVKFMDRRGLTKDEAGFNRGLDLAEKLVTGSGGFIQFRDLAQFSQQGGTAFRSLSDQGLTNMALLLQEQGGARAGTAMMSIYQNLVAGRTPVKTMHLLEDYGLGKIGQKTSGTVGGRSSTSNTFALNPAYAAVLQADPVEFFRSIFLPKLAAKGITSEAGILKATNDLLSNRTASGQASIMTTQLMQIARDAALTKNAMGDKQVIDQYKKDPNSQWGDLSAKYTNLMLELGEAALPLVVKAIGGLISVVKGLTDFARNFPTTTKVLMVAFSGLGALMLAGGAVTLIVAGFKALGLALLLSKGAGLGAMLMETASGIGALSLQLAKAGIGQIAAVGAAGYAGYQAGSWLNNKFHLDEKIGGLFSQSYDPNATATRGKSTIAGKGGSGLTVHTQINMDGRKVADAVTAHQARGVASPYGGANFDGTMHPATVVMNQSH